MNYFNTDYLIVYAFLLITLYIGLRAGRGIKDIREYAIANKMYGTGALVLTYLATDIGGWTILGETGEVFANGIIIVAAYSGLFLTFIIRAFFIAPKMIHFSGCLTMGDVMERLYGTPGKVISGVLGVLYAAIVAAMQLITLGSMFELLLGIKGIWGIGVGGLVMAVYSAHGGIKAVTVTDIFQFIVLVIIIPILTTLAVEHVGGIKVMFSKVPSEKLLLLTHEDFPRCFVLFLMFSFLQLGMIDPAIVQRMLMGQNKRQLRNKYLCIAAFDPALRLALLFIALAGMAMYDSKTISSQDVVVHLVQDILPTGIKGLAIAGLLGTLMSTGDSYLHAAGLSFTRDVVKPIYDSKNIDINELKWARWATVITGLGAIIMVLTLGSGAATALDLFFVVTELTAPMLMFPMISGIVGLKPDQRSFYVAVGSTIVAFSLCKLFLPVGQSYLSVLISTLANGVGFFGAHVMQHGGFAIVHRTPDAVYDELWLPKKETVKEFFGSLVPTPQRIVQYSQQKVQRYGAPFVAFGVFCCVNLTVPYFMWSHESLQQYHLITYLRLIGGVMGALLIVREKWSKQLLPYFPTFWHLTILYCLPFISTVMFLLTQGKTEWLINIMGVIMFLIVLVDWVTFVILSVLGIALGFLFYSLAVGPISLQLDFSTGYLLLYQGIFGTIIGLLFARRKQRRVDELTDENEFLTAGQEKLKEQYLEVYRDKIRIIQSLHHAGVQDLLQAVLLLKDMRKKLQEERASGADAIAKQLQDTLIPKVLQLRGLPSKASQYMRLSAEECALQDLLASVRAELTQKGLQNVRLQLSTQLQTLVCDAKRLKELLVNAVVALHKPKDKNQVLLIGVEDTALHYPLPAVRPSYVKQIAALRLIVAANATPPALQEAYRPPLDGEAIRTLPDTTQDAGLMENERIVQAHYGYSGQQEQQQGQQSVLYYVIPVDLRTVRPKDLDKDYMNLGAAPVRANDQSAEAKRAQNKLFRLMHNRMGMRVDLETVESVLELIKWYHGPAKRRSGEPFYLHPLAVANIVLNFPRVDNATVIAALLHDTVEDTGLLLEEIEAVFGQDAAKLVKHVTNNDNVHQSSFYKVRLSDEENMMRLESLGNDRALYVKLADRLHNMRTIDVMSAESQICKAKETLAFYVPQAERLKMPNVARELRTLSNRVLKKYAGAAEMEA